MIGSGRVGIKLWTVPFSIVMAKCISRMKVTATATMTKERTPSMEQMYFQAEDHFFDSNILGDGIQRRAANIFGAKNL
jgi:hypothetical protein